MSRKGILLALLMWGCFIKTDAQSTQNERNTSNSTRMVQFADLPDATEHKELKELGVTLHYYMGNNAYLTELPNALQASDLAPFGVIGIQRVAPQKKLSNDLFNGIYPAHAVEGDDLYVTVMHQPEKNDTEIAAFIETHQWELVKNLHHRNAFTALLPIAELHELPQEDWIWFVEPMEEEAVAENHRGRTNHRVNTLGTDYAGGLNFNGQGVNVAMGDDGIIGPHIDYQGRIDQQYSDPSSGNHGDHVAGIVMGAGNMDRRGRGNASGAFLYVYEPFANVDSALNHYFTHDIRLTTTSYGNGCNAGYTSYASYADQTIRLRPKLMHVFSAGNSGTSNCNYGAGSGWGNITGGIKVGKNVLAVGNVQFTDQIANSSSRGPAADGRIKPDVCAVGTSVYSTIDVNDYASFTGTSMACPGVTGTLAVLYNAYESLYGEEPISALIKGVLMNTAEDLGNPGPDFTYGFGRINARRAYEVLEAGQFIIDSIDPSEILTYTIPVPNNIREVRVMIYWNDREGAPNASTPLVNNLNMQVVTPTSTYLPWVLDPTPNSNNLSANAVRGTDVLNNVEQVTVLNPDFTTMDIQVNGASIPFAGQEFVLVYEFVSDDVVLTYPLGGETFEPGTNEVIRWDATPGTSTFQVKYSTNAGGTWTTLSSNVSASLRYYSWTVPNNVSDEVLFAVSRGISGDTSHTYLTIMETVSGTSVTSICPDTLSLTWNAVPGATHYIVTRLGAEYMDSVGVLTGTLGSIGGHNHLADHYYALQPVFASGRKGPRQTAFFVPAGLANCQIDTDLSLSLLSPAGSSLIQCTQSTSPQPVVIKITNEASTAVSNIPVSYTLNGITYTDTLNTTLNSGQSAVFTFQDSIPSGVTSGNLGVFVAHPGDQDPSNNGTFIDFSWTVGAPASVPYTEGFDAFGLCNSGLSCQTFCPLLQGWYNAINGVQDGIDWLVYQGNSGSNGPSAGVGNTGRYLLVDPSNCTGEIAEMYTPCFSLPTNQVAFATFSTYRNSWGSEPDLTMDLITENGIVENAMLFNSSGTSGSWVEDTLSLAPYAGQSVSFRIRAKGQTKIGFDAFEIQFASAAPIAQAQASNSAFCKNETLTLTDLSQGFPAQRSWVITPAYAQYINGTDSTDAVAQVRFTQSGTYTIQLNVSNTFGSDSDVISGGVIVDAGVPIPYISTFDSDGNCPTTNTCEAIICPIANWNNLQNGTEDDIDWRVNSGSTPSSNTGPSSGYGGSGKYVYLESSGSCTGKEAILMSECIDLSNVPSAELELNYHMFGGTMGEMHVDVISNGDYFADVTPALVGSQINQWLTRTVNLNPFIGTTVQIVFRGITGSGITSDMALDQISVSTGINPPVSGITSNAGAVNCVGNVIIFNENATGNVDSYSWNFGLGASPATASGPGPIAVVYSTSGTKTITLTVQNTGGSNVGTSSLNIDEPAIAAFGAAYLGSNTWFLNPSGGVVDSVSWSYGDGMDTTLLSTGSVQHTYTANGIFTITQIVYSPCGSDTATSTIEVTEVGVSEWELNGEISAYPNPSNGNVSIQLFHAPNLPLKVTLFDTRGRSIWSRNTVTSADSRFTVSLEDLSQGAYLLEVDGFGRILLQKMDLAK